jgi:hypothetical protein
MHIAEAKVVAFSRNSKTRRGHQYAWGRWLYVMQRANQGFEITPARIETFIRACLADKCTHGGIASYLSSIVFMVPVVAPKTSKTNLQILKDTRSKEIERHGPPAAPEFVHPSKLTKAGLELMARAERSTVSSKSAIEYRDGLLMVCGTVIPARGINLGGLRIGHDLFLDDNPRIQWEAITIKGRKAHTYSLPEELAAPMRRFAEKYRPMLMGADAETQDWFWGPRRGGSGENRELTTAAINGIVARRSLELVKKRVTGHSRRHAIGTMFTEEAPESIRHVTPLLQQGDPRSREFYNRRAKKVTATKLAAECLSVLRRSRQQ